MQYGYQTDTRQKQIEEELKSRMSFDQALEYYEHVIAQIENKWAI